MSADGGIRRHLPHTAELGLVVLALGLSLFTVVVVALPTAVPALVNDRFDVMIITAATLVAGAVAALDWARGRVAHDPAALLRSSAFAVLALLNSLTLIAGIVGADARLGATLDDPGQLPIIAGVVGRGVSAALLVAAGWVALSRGVPALRPVLVLVGPAAAVFGVLVIAALVQDALPLLTPPSVLDGLTTNPTDAVAVGAAPALVVIQTVIGAGFLLAALLAHRSYRRSGRAADVLLAAGLLIAAFSQVHSALHPGSFAGVVTIGDVLRLAFYAVLLIGVVAERREDLAELRAATMEVRRLAESEFASVALEERARLAREIHDGLAQNLWYAKLKQSRLSQIAGFDSERSS